MTPSSRLSRDISSPSGGLRGLLFALSGAGKIHCTLALAQLEHGYCLLHRTLRRRHITHDRGFNAGLAGSVDDAVIEGSDEGLEELWVLNGT